MTHRGSRTLRLLHLGLLGPASALALAACFTDASQVTVDSSMASDAGPEAMPTEASPETGGGANGSPDASATPDADAAMSADAEASVETGPDAQEEGGPDVAGEAAPDVAGEAAADVAVEAAPDIDAGAGCLSPGTQSPLSPATEGLPSTGLVLWLRGDHGVYMTSANAVCAWRDQSGNDRLVTPSSVRPTWASAGLGGLPAIHANAVGMDMGTDLVGIAPTSARTFIAVTQLVALAGRFHPILQGQGGSAGTYLGIDANTWQTAGSREGAYVTASSFDTAQPTNTSPHVHVLTVSTMTPGTAVTAAVDYRIDGATQTLSLRAGSGSMQDFSAANFTTIADVSGTPSTGVYGDAYIAEAIIYDRALTTVESAAVETALKTRYGIP